MVKSYHHINLVNDASFLINSKESILEASLKKEIPFCCECGGKARCSTCRILIVKGEENLSEINAAEAKLRTYFELPKNVRLACQTYVKSGSVKIKRIMNDESDYPLYLRNKLNKNENIGRELRLCLLFLDVRNFTPFAEQHLAFDVIHIIRKLFFNFEKIIQQFEGKIIETNGDGLYVAFGFEKTTKASVLDTVNCGFAILKELKRLNTEYFQRYFNEEIEVGIGAHLGKVATGDLLLENRPHQIVMGYAVNVAARIQELTKKLDNSFVISEAVYELLDTPPEAEVSSEKMKGVKEAFRLYKIGEHFQYKKEK